MKRVIGCQVFAVLLLNEKRQELRVRSSSGHPEEAVRKLRIKVGDGIVGRAASERRSILVNDVRNESAYIESVPTVKSELAIPLILKNRVIGVMDLEAPSTGFFTDQHVNLLELLAGRMAMAIENARLYRRSLRQARTLQLLNEISRELSSVLVLNDLRSRIRVQTDGKLHTRRDVTIAALLLSLASLELGALLSSLHAVVSTVFFVGWLYLMWMSYGRRKVGLPLIGEMAEKLAGDNEPSAPAGTIGKAA